jgi:hypothetical protein
MLKIVLDAAALAAVLLGALFTTPNNSPPNRASSSPVPQYIPRHCGFMPKNWSGPYPDSGHSDELLKTGHMDVGVRIATSNPILAREARHAMNFWSAVLDMSWHEVDDPKAAAIQFVDGTTQILMGNIAQSQFPDWRRFQGLIALDPKTRLTGLMTARDTLVFYVMAHEIGHLWGLRHIKDDPSSLMYKDLVCGTEVLDSDSLATLRARHVLRPGLPNAPIQIVYPAGKPTETSVPSSHGKDSTFKCVPHGKANLSPTASVGHGERYARQRSRSQVGSQER